MKTYLPACIAEAYRPTHYMATNRANLPGRVPTNRHASVSGHRPPRPHPPDDKDGGSGRHLRVGDSDLPAWGYRSATSAVMSQGIPIMAPWNMRENFTD